MAMIMKKELNSNVLKDRARIIMHAKITSKLPIFIKKGQNYTVSKDNIRIPTFERISSELQCL